MKFYFRCFATAVIANFFFLPSIQAVSLYTPDSILEAKPLSGKEGYLLIDLDVNGASPSLEFIGLSVRNQNFLTAGQKPRTKGKAKTINLKGKTAGVYLAKLPAGLYQIKTINVPYFDLPYRLNTESRREWRFSIEAGKVNYVGKLVIDKERSTRNVDVNLINRIATNKSEIESQLTTILPSHPLRLGAGVRDDFFKELTGK